MVANIIGGAMNLLGGLANAGSNLATGFMSYGSAKKLQDSQNAFTERMSNTSYQRAVADMRAANLNPALMFSSGSAASTPSAGTSSGVQFGNPAEGFISAAQGIANVRNTAKQGALLDQQAQTEASKRKALEADASFKTAENIRQDKKLDPEIRKMGAETQNLIAQSLLSDEIRKYTGYNANTARINAGASVTSANAAKQSASTKTLSQYAGKWTDDFIGSYGNKIKDWAFDPKRSKYSRAIWKAITQ